MPFAVPSTTPVCNEVKSSGHGIGVGDAPNGRNINDGVGSEHPERLADQASLGLGVRGAAEGGHGGLFAPSVVPAER